MRPFMARVAKQFEPVGLVQETAELIGTVTFSEEGWVRGSWHQPLGRRPSAIDQRDQIRDGGAVMHLVEAAVRNGGLGCGGKG